MVLLDTNIFLEVFLDQERASSCLSLLNQVENGTIKALVTDFAVHSIGVIMEKMGKGENLPEIFASLSVFEGLTLIQASLEEQAEIAVLSGETALDFDNAYQTYFAKKFNMPVVSFDYHLDPFIVRKEPQDMPKQKR